MEREGFIVPTRKSLLYLKWLSEPLFLCSEWVCGQREPAFANIFKGVVFMKRFFAFFLTAMLLISAIPVLAEQDDGHVAELRIGTTASCETVNLITSSGSFAKMCYNAICAAPWLINTIDGGFEAFIMTDWEVSEDQLTLTATFATDQGIEWHDGTPLTMDDIIFTFEYYKQNGWSVGLAYDTIAQVDDKTAVFTFTEPTAYSYLQKLVMSEYVYPKHIWEGVEDYNTLSNTPEGAIGCGPYKLTLHDAEAQLLVFEACADTYMGRELTVDKVTVKTYESNEALVMALIADEIDAMYNYSNSLDSSMRPSVTGVENLDSGMSINPGNFQLVFGFNVAPTNDLNFRKAVYYALDYELLAVTIGGEDGLVPNIGVISPTTLAYDDSLQTNVRDIEKAAEILDEAGYVDANGDGLRDYPDGSALEVLVTPQYNESRAALYMRIAEIMISNLADIGVEAVLDEESVRNSDYATEFRRSGEYQLFIGYTSPGMARYEGAFYYAALGANATNPWGTCNVEAFNDAYYAMAGSASTEEYLENYATLQQVAADNMVMLALAWDACYFPYRTDKYEGWINFPGYGVINNQTWYTVHAK